jgi:hypothetical protein
MNSLKRLFIFLLVSFYSISAFSQDNIAKVALEGLAFGKVGLSYERVVNKKQSLALSVGVLIPREFPSAFTTQRTTMSATKFSGFSIVPEYRFYTRREGAPGGFYVAPYVNVSNYSVVFKDSYDDKDISVKGGFFTAGAGVQIGVQWIISDVFSIDWTIIGLGVSRYEAYGKLTSKDSDFDFQDINNSIEEESATISLIGNKIKTDVGSDYLKVSMPIFHVGVRSSLTIGFAF